MTSNIHNVERAARIAIGAALLVFFYFDPSNFWYLIGILPLVTGLVGWCPPYALFGFSTKRSCAAPSPSDKAA